MNVPDRAGEEEFVRRSRMGDREAFQQLVVLYGERAYRTAYALLGSHHDAEEATQDAFLKAFLHIRQFKGQSGFYTWLYRILSRTCYERVRSAGRRAMRRAISLEGSEAGQVLRVELPSPTEGPRDAAGASESLQMLRTALRALSREDYQILALRALEGLSYEDIAEALGCPMGTVMSRLYRARLRLCQALGKHAVAKN